MPQPLACHQPSQADHAQLYEMLVGELTDFVVFLMDPHGCIVSWNPGVERILGYGEAEWLDQSAERIFTPEDRAQGKPQEELAKAAREGRAADIRWHLRKNGERLYVEGTMVALRDEAGQLLGFSKVMRDITERKKRELALQDAVQYAESIVDTVREPLLVLDGSFRVQFANCNFYRQFQVSAEKTQGQLLYELGNGQWNLPTLRALLEEILPQSKTVEGFEVEVDFPQIGRKVMLLNARKLWREGNHAELILLALEDITERRQAAVQQAALLELGERLRELRNPMEMAEAAIRLLGRTLGVMQVGYGTVDTTEEVITVERDWTNGQVPPATGRYQFAEYGAALVDHLKRGEILAIPDVANDDRTADHAENFAGLGVRALLEVPVLAGGRLVAALRLHHAQPHAWSEEEIHFVRKVLDRMGMAIERARAEEQLRASEERFRALVCASSEVLYRMSPDWTEMWQLGGGGFIPDQENSSSAWLQDYIPSDEQPRVLEAIENAIRTKSMFELEHQVQRVDGTLGWAFSRAIPLFEANGNVITEWFGAANDITARKAVEAERERLLQQIDTERQRLAQVFQQAPVAVVVLQGRDLVVELANPFYQALLPGRDLVGRSFAEVVPELETEVWDAFHQVLDTGEPFAAQEWLIPYDQNGDGEKEDHWFTVLYHPLREVEGSVSGLVAVCSEVTAQVHARQELERVNRELEEFAYVASHDLQEPLRMVNIYTQLILKHLPGDGTALAEYAGFVRQGITRMEGLIRDLLMYSRVVHREPLPVGTADLSASFREAVAVLQSRIEESGATITASPLPTVCGDTKQMAQVFQNLLSNALKYRQADTVPQIEVAAKRDGAQWLVSVRDNGIGFEPQYAERIFGLFKRLHTDEYPGTGLGLAICQRIVGRYGGRLWAEGRPGQGATFFFVLLDAGEN